VICDLFGLACFRHLSVLVEDSDLFIIVGFGHRHLPVLYLIVILLSCGIGENNAIIILLKLITEVRVVCHTVVTVSK